jgi:hypothetical protein
VKTLWPAFLLGAMSLAAQPPQPVAARTQVPQIQVQQRTQQQSTVKRASMQAAERNIDARLAGANAPDPAELTGNTRGIYLPGFGVVMTAEVALIRLPGPSPFHLTFTTEEKAKARARKLEALPKLREAMKAALTAAAGELQTMPLNEKIILGVNLFYWNWEDPSGLPAQIVMQGTRQQLASRLEAVQVQEF